jgi:hypothetical protein
MIAFPLPFESLYSSWEIVLQFSGFCESVFSIEQVQFEQHWQETPQEGFEEEDAPVERDEPLQSRREDCRKIRFLKADFIRLLRPSDQELPLLDTAKPHSPCQPIV